MLPSVPAFDRVVAKYRRDVHHLPAAAPPEALAKLARHLGAALPDDLQRFMGRHNGAQLFRGRLRLRSASEMTPANEAAPGVVLFAEAVGAHRDREVRWAWAPTRTGVVFGRWADAGLEPMYASFTAFLSAEIAVLDADPDDEGDALRLGAAPGDPWQLLRAGARARADGAPERAAELLGAAVEADPTNPRSWQELGDAHDTLGRRDIAVRAWMEAVRHTHFPLAWPGAPSIDAALILRLAALTPAGWGAALGSLLAERVGDVTTATEARVVEAAGIALARELSTGGRRGRARDVLQSVLGRARNSPLGWMPWDASLALVDLHIGLGEHDDAEALLRELRMRGPPDRQGAGHLKLAEIAVIRQEPWAEDAAREAFDAGLPDVEALRLQLTRVERAVRRQRHEDVAALVGSLASAVEAQGDPALQAHLAMARADVARCADDLDEAERTYLTGLQALDDAPLNELALRIRLRLADLYRQRGDREAAEELASQVAEGFRSTELPIREAWALVRVAQVVAEGARDDPEAQRRAQGLRQAARDRFLDADLAAGVAAVDSLEGRPGASLAWHLERASEHARARYDAQRCRPPLTRADADRPERRLGAHRFAIAACDAGIVQALAAEMDQGVRATRASKGRTTEPAVLRYIAAVDLLAGHRSYDAAKVLLEHLTDRGVGGPMQRALQGAIARSPNAALVDGLLRCVESPEAMPPMAVASAAELLGLRREKAAVRPLVRLLDRPGANAARKAALTALGRIGDRRVVEALVPALQEPRLAESTALSLLMLGDRRGVDFHGQALVDQRNDLQGSPGEIVGRYGGPDYLLLLMRAAKGEGERALGALQGLGLMGDPRGVPALLEALHAKTRRVVEVASGALQILTGHQQDALQPGVRGRWQAWFDEHGGEMPEGERHRYGVRFDVEALIARMDHDDPWTRRTAYDELVITTGQALPFDADGPWRVQQAHRRAWRAWWAEARSEWRPGRWYLDGTCIH